MRLYFSANKLNMRDFRWVVKNVKNHVHLLEQININSNKNLMNKFLTNKKKVSEIVATVRRLSKPWLSMKCMFFFPASIPCDSGNYYKSTNPAQ